MSGFVVNKLSAFSFAGKRRINLQQGKTCRLGYAFFCNPTFVESMCWVNDETFNPTAACSRLISTFQDKNYNQHRRRRFLRDHYPEESHVVVDQGLQI